MRTGFYITAFIFCFGVNSLQAKVCKQVENSISQVQEWVNQNVRYPEIAKQQKKEGIVFVEFEVSNGKIASSKIIQEADPSLNQAALNIVHNLPSDLLKSTEKAIYILPIKFDLI
ncbi:MAG: TonB family protein [Crocinitomicaceae bacterium]